MSISNIPSSINFQPALQPAPYTHKAGETASGAATKPNLPVTSVPANSPVDSDGDHDGDHGDSRLDKTA